MSPWSKSKSDEALKSDIERWRKERATLVYEGYGKSSAVETITEWITVTERLIGERA